MGTIAENRDAWSHYDWSQGGDEWSECWGSTESLWWTTVFPRICRFLPARRILEIAPGFGRITQYLKEVCDELVIVDLTERCIEACRSRFATSSNITYLVNDGRSLDAVADDSIDFVFSYDSLVHADGEVVASYVEQIGRKLRREGAAFLHHSNLGAYRNPATGALTVENPHWRADTMSADDLIRSCEAAGLVCVSQELVAWGGDVLNDCFSTFVVRGSAFERASQRVENTAFMQEAARAQMLANVYGLGAPTRDRSEGVLARLRKLHAAP